MHPIEDIRGVRSSKLAKKRIVLGITGSIAAVETVKLARMLIRDGADVFPVMTEAATRIIHPDALEFATGNKPIVKLTGATEHVTFCGKTKNPADLLLISPCTANTISKIALGIDDTPVTTFASTAIGSGIPIIIVPAMHISMYDHKIVQENIKKCKKIGIKFVKPNLVGNKAKMADIDEIVSFSIRSIWKQDLVGKKVLIIGGGTAEPIDSVRAITNQSSGKTAVELALNSYERGADVKLWYGTGTMPNPSFIDYKHFITHQDLTKLAKTGNLKQYDTIIICAAISDYIPKKQKEKIPSNKDKLAIELITASKIIEQIRKLAPKTKIIGFKLEDEKKHVEKKAYDLLKKNKLDYVIGNTVEAFGKDQNTILIVDSKGKTKQLKDTKENLADHINSLINN